MTDPQNSRISVSEDRLRALFAELKLDIFEKLDQYATKDMVDKLNLRVTTLEKAITDATAVTRTQKTIIGAAIVIFVPIIIAVINIAGGVH